MEANPDEVVEVQTVDAEGASVRGKVVIEKHGTDTATMKKLTAASTAIVTIPEPENILVPMSSQRDPVKARKFDALLKAGALETHVAAAYQEAFP